MRWLSTASATADPDLAVAARYRPAVVLPPLLLGVFLRALQMTVIGPSLVDIAQSLGSTLADVGWIMAIYATGSLVAQPIAGRLSDARGRRKVFIAALGIFIVGSLGCALSTSLGWLIAGRVVQSLGAGALQPAAIALVGQRVPKDRQSSALYALYGMFALAGALGAVLGGTIVDGGKALGESSFVGGALQHELTLFPWHLIFWINLPLAVAALVLAFRMTNDEPAGEPIRLDVGALVLIPAAALCLMMAANAAAGAGFFWLGLALVSIAALAVWERRARDAFFDPSLFARRGPLLLYGIAVLTGIPIFSVTMYSAAYYMASFQASAAQAGFALLALALPLGAGQGVGGRLIRRTGARALLSAGLVALAAGEIAIATLHTVTGALFAFAIIGFGIGLASAPPNALILRYFSQRRSGAATGLLTMLSSTGAITAPAVVSAVLHDSALPTAQGFRFEFALSFMLAALAIPLSMLLPRPDES
ncbi:MAG: MFS transporter [Candidatus Eremiobacteraeota bacterium]|nr:MFS transporter [Candidatus Eremiobacteraeota bacterium]